jgi:uncharacterized YccA/Bax inhibitor family protein
MALNNPAFSRNPAFQPGKGTATATSTVSAADLQRQFESPSAGARETGRMTTEDTVLKTAICFVVLLAGGVVGWVFPSLIVVAVLVGFGLAMVNIFKRKPSPALILAYAAVQGIAVGAISALFENLYPGIVIQAVLATVAVFGVTLVLFAFGKIRASARATKIFLIAMVGYLVYSVLNVILVATGVVHNAFGLSGDVKIFGIPLGFLIGILVVLMAAYSLVLDFDAIKRGVANRAPRVYAWTGAFGIMVTVVWLYLELLRMFAIARN